MTADDWNLAGVMPVHEGMDAPEVGLEVLGDLADEALKRQLADEELGRLLVATDLTERDGSRCGRVRARRWFTTHGGIGAAS
jgi:hypothetical protein